MKVFRSARWATAATVALSLTLSPTAAVAAVDEPDPTGLAAAAALPVQTCRLPSVQDSLNEGFPVADEALPAVGRLRATMIFVDFPDAQAPRGSVLKHEHNLRSGVDYLEELSGGRLDIELDAGSTWVRMPTASTEYPFQRGLTYEDHVAYIEDAVRAADPTTDFSRTDVVWVVATERAPAISFSPTTNFLDVTADGRALTHAVTFGFDQWRWGGLVLAHETGHTLGLPDLYDFRGVPRPDGTVDGHPHVGGWDLMGLISGQAPEFLGWHRWLLGWIDDRQVACLDPADERTTTVRLRAIEDRLGTVLAVLPLSSSRALVLESRRARGYDQEILREGVLIYTVDTTVATGSGPVRVVDIRPGTASGFDDAPLQAGQRWTDPESGVVITVERSRAEGDTVSVRAG